MVDYMLDLANFPIMVLIGEDHSYIINHNKKKLFNIINVNE